MKSIPFMFLVLLALFVVEPYVSHGFEVDDIALKQNSLHLAILRIFKGYSKLVDEDENNEKKYKLIPTANNRNLQLITKNDRDCLEKMKEEESNVLKKKKYYQQKRGGIQSLAKNRDFPRKTEPQSPQKELVGTYNYSYREEP